jgi:hypothetical protein
MTTTTTECYYVETDNDYGHTTHWYYIWAASETEARDEAARRDGERIGLDRADITTSAVRYADLAS